MDNTPKIYVACLAAYNNGKLHGAWINCDQEADEIRSEIETMLHNSPEENAEEWAIHDYENWHEIKIEEYEDINKIVELASLIDEHGAAFTYYYDSFGQTNGFEDGYCGCYESEADFVKESFAEQGIIERCEQAGLSEYYIDWERMARDWFIDSYVSQAESHDKVHVFHR
ncbi:antirestriction protein ArdA [Merismopedia glauca]|uniref:Antirestriction protein ArdA n=1 Tax=Merismopedia glauca CCAP 1448/3 TaxID=1296344 RepID=A0A2T1BWL7_9CYAN|nr:antirestriction protein ArdA [Merismopedia glauca]PSB00406.1 antirestriction protein ArdA [Merismopedia glauca CCAP 1448/3]